MIDVPFHYLEETGLEVTLDSETCGFYGMPVLIQYAINDDEEVFLHEIWKRPARDTIELIEWMCKQKIIGFNLSFDWFHICKIYTTLILLDDWGKHPGDCIYELAILEERARWTDVCVKPLAAFDLMLHARKGPYQSLMARDPIRIRRVPTALAFQLADELNRRIKFDDIYFAKGKATTAGGHWKVFDIVDKQTNRIKPDFKDVVLRFRASGALKNLYRHAFNVTDTIEMFSNIELDKRWRPNEVGFAPFALASAKLEGDRYDKKGQKLLNPEDRDYSKIKFIGHDCDFYDGPDRVAGVLDWNWTWPQVIHEHILHWNYHSAAREYAANDVRYTRRLYKDHFNSPAPGDVDSDLACMVAACRWHGYAVDIDAIRKLRDSAIARIKNTPTAPGPVMRWLKQCLSDLEKLGLESTKKVVLEELVKDKDWIETNPEVVRRAKAVLDARKAKKEEELYDKLLLALRFHASFVVIGTLSSRMAGADQLNAQGIKHDKTVRAAFPLCDDPLGCLCGGDFKSFEVSLAAKVFDSPKLNEDLINGVKLHAVFAMDLFPGISYETILDSDGKGDKYGIDYYDTGKKGVFSIFYGGEDYTLQKRLGVAIEIAHEAFMKLTKRYKEIGEDGKKMQQDYASLSQPGGIGSKIDYKTPKDYVESFLGFRRYFTLENRVIKLLFELASSPPQTWKNLKVKVVRRERIQTAGGAVMSALFGAAFGLQSSIIRQAKNHRIQSPGAEITKAVQHAMWEHQPVGVHPFVVQPMNIHDEIMSPTKRTAVDVVRETVQNTVARFKKVVPLLAIDWFVNIPNWASKKGAPIEPAESTVPALQSTV